MKLGSPLGTRLGHADRGRLTCRPGRTAGAPWGSGEGSERLQGPLVLPPSEEEEEERRFCPLWSLGVISSISVGKLWPKAQRPLTEEGGGDGHTTSRTRQRGRGVGAACPSHGCECGRPRTCRMTQCPISAAMSRASSATTSCPCPRDTLCSFPLSMVNPSFFPEGKRTGSAWGRLCHPAGNPTPPRFVCYCKKHIKFANFKPIFKCTVW